MSSVRVRRSRRGRRVDATGRSVGSPKFTMLFKWFLDTPAWRSLSPQARCIYLEIAQRYNGSNNGEISLSVRESARLVHIAKDTASKAFHELEQKGFIRRHVCGSFNWKLKHATTWILTEHTFQEQPATKDFARWHPATSEGGPNSGTNGPKSETLSQQRKALSQKLVLIWDLVLGSALILGPNRRHAYSLPCHAPRGGVTVGVLRTLASRAETTSFAAWIASVLPCGRWAP